MCNTVWVCIRESDKRVKEYGTAFPASYHWYMYIGCQGYMEGESEVGGNCNAEHVHL